MYGSRMILNEREHKWQVFTGAGCHLGDIPEADISRDDKQGGLLVPEEWSWELRWSPPRRRHGSRIRRWWRARKCAKGKHRVFLFEAGDEVWRVCHDCMFKSGKTGDCHWTQEALQGACNPECRYSFDWSERA